MQQWRDQFEQQALPNLRDVVTIDLDEVRNQVAIGLADGSGGAAVAKALSDLGVPPEGMRIETRGWPQPLSSIRDRVRPVVGALGTGVIWWGLVHKDTLCTLAFNATYNGTPVTFSASHCTQQTYGLDATRAIFYQESTEADSDRVGVEWQDPPWYGNGHRHSDVAMIKYDSSASFDFGYIARTTWSDSTWGYNGSFTIDPANPRFRIVGEWDRAVVGEPLEKIGWKTGWTSGTVTATCEDVVLQDGFYRDCSEEATTYADEGDSGSPVFYRMWWTGSDVDIVGIVFAKLNNNRMAFSPMADIRLDFPGSMVVAVPGPPPNLSVDIVGPHSVPTNYGMCYWQGVVLSEDGTPPYYYDWYINDEWYTNGDQLDYGGPNSFKLTLQVHDSGVPVRTGERVSNIWALWRHLREPVVRRPLRAREGGSGISGLTLSLRHLQEGGTCDRSDRLAGAGRGHLMRYRFLSRFSTSPSAAAHPIAAAWQELP